MPGSEYLDLLAHRAADLHRRGQVATPGRTSPSLPWPDLGLERIDAFRPPCNCLSVCAYLAPEPIPGPLHYSSRIAAPALAAAAIDPLAFADTMAVLADYSSPCAPPPGSSFTGSSKATIRARHLHVGPATQARESTGQKRVSAGVAE